jgi:hypothetical protein
MKFLGWKCPLEPSYSQSQESSPAGLAMVQQTITFTKFVWVCVLTMQTLDWTYAHLKSLSSNVWSLISNVLESHGTSNNSSWAIRLFIHKNGSFPHCLQIQPQWITQWFHNET